MRNGQEKREVGVDDRKISFQNVSGIKDVLVRLKVLRVGSIQAICRDIVSKDMKV